MRKVFVLMCLVAASLVALVGSASAGSGPDRPDPAPGWTKTQGSDVGTQALTCNPGDLCAWPVIDGSSNRCSWTNSDADWRSAPVTCSWSRDRPVKALFNNGRNATYEGVCVYRGANYTNVEIFLFQGESATNPTGVILRSHRWVRVGQPC